MKDIDWKDMEDKVICPKTGLCERHQQCGGAIPHDHNSCDPCPVYPGTKCIPVLDFVGYAKDCLVHNVASMKGDPNFEKIVRQTTRSVKFLEDRIKYAQRTYDNFGSQF